MFQIGDRITLIDRYMYRAGDVGTIEEINERGIQILWDTFPQPPTLWRTFSSVEIKSVQLPM